MSADLIWDACVSKRITALNYGYARYFRFNSVINRLPLCAQVQLLQTLVISGVNYLIGALPITAVQSKKMDAAARRSVRRIFGVPSKAPNELVDAEVPFLPFSSTILMHQVRLYLSIKHNPFQQMPAAQIIAFGEAAKLHASSFVSRTMSVLAAQRNSEGRGLTAQPMSTMPLVSAAADIHNAVVCLKRSDAFRTNRTDLPHGGVPGVRKAAEQLAAAAAAAIRPPSTPPKAHVSALHCVGIVHPRDLGELHYATRFSYVGSGGCSGASVLGVTNVRGVATSLIMKLRMGRAGFAHPPFRLRPEKTAAESTQTSTQVANGDAPVAAPSPASAPVQESFADMSAHNGKCPMCNSEGHLLGPAFEDTPFHLLCECTNAVIQKTRGQLQEAAPLFIATLCESLAKECGSDNEEVQAAAASAISTVTVEDIDWSTTDGKHVLYRMVLAVPFPAAAVTAASPAAGLLPISLALGTLFDSIVVPKQKLRKPCNTWALWASLWARALAAARGSVLAPAKKADAQPMVEAIEQDADSESMDGGSDDSDDAEDG
jgi:hypothetical protein